LGCSQQDHESSGSIKDGEFDQLSNHKLSRRTAFDKFSFVYCWWIQGWLSSTTLCFKLWCAVIRHSSQYTKAGKNNNAYKTAVNAICTRYITLNNEKHKSIEENL